MCTIGQGFIGGGVQAPPLRTFLKSNSVAQDTRKCLLSVLSKLSTRTLNEFFVLPVDGGRFQWNPNGEEFL